MNDATLAQFRNMAGALAKREKVAIDITLKNGRALSGLYDPLFKTVTIGGMTFPKSELNTWTRLCWGSVPESIATKNF
jgi:hypothetical protein